MDVLHHINGDRNDNRSANLIELCNTCHKHVHGWSVNDHPWLEKIGKTEKELKRLRPENYRYVPIYGRNLKLLIWNDYTPNGMLIAELYWNWRKLRYEYVRYNFDKLLEEEKI